jgi:hypothetical protein
MTEQTRGWRVLRATVAAVLFMAAAAFAAVEGWKVAVGHRPSFHGDNPANALLILLLGLLGSAVGVATVSAIAGLLGLAAYVRTSAKSAD